MAQHPLSNSLVRKYSAGLPCSCAFVKKEFNPRLVQLAANILNLSLTETAEMGKAIQAKFSASPEEAAWFLPASTANTEVAAPAEAAPVVEAAPAAPAKTHFDVKLKSFDAAQKLKVIKEVRAISGLGLKEVLYCAGLLLERALDSPGPCAGERTRRRRARIDR
jgi:large subunit ribosomal protein L7/L12